MEGLGVQVSEHAVVFTSSRRTLGHAAQQETPILNVDDIETAPDFVEVNPEVYVALAELLGGEALDIVQEHHTRVGLGRLAATLEEVWPADGGQETNVVDFIQSWNRWSDRINPERETEFLMMRVPES